MGRTLVANPKGRLLLTRLLFGLHLVPNSPVDRSPDGMSRLSRIQREVGIIFKSLPEFIAASPCIVRTAGDESQILVGLRAVRLP